MSVVSFIKEAQLKIQEKDYVGAYSLSSQAMQFASENAPLNLLILHGQCAHHVEKYKECTKSYLDAIKMDKEGQFHQKLWKVCFRNGRAVSKC